MMPFESAYGEIEVKSFLNRESFFQSIENISSFKVLQKEEPDSCQILPNFSLDIKGVSWNKAGYTKPFGIVFAYDSIDPNTVLKYFHEIRPLNPSLMPDMIVLFSKKTIIFRVNFEKEKLYPTLENTYQGFMTVPCGEDTLPIFLSYVLSRTVDTHLKIMNTSNVLCAQIDKHVREIQSQPIVKFSKQHIEDN